MGRPFLTLLPAGEWQALSEYVQKVLNLKHAWEFVLDKDVLVCPSDFAVLSHFARLVNEGFFEDGGAGSYPRGDRSGDHLPQG